MDPNLEKQNQSKFIDQAPMEEEQMNEPEFVKSETEFEKSLGSMKKLDVQKSFDLLSADELTSIQGPERDKAAAENLKVLIQDVNPSINKDFNALEWVYEKTGMMEGDLLKVYESWEYDEDTMRKILGNYLDQRNLSGDSSVAEAATHALSYFYPPTAIANLSFQSCEVDFYNKENVDKVTQGIVDKCYELGVGSKEAEKIINTYVKRGLFLPEINNELSDENRTMIEGLVAELDILIGDEMQQSINEGKDVSGLTEFRTKGLDGVIDAMYYLKTGNFISDQMREVIRDYAKTKKDFSQIGK